MISRLPKRLVWIVGLSFLSGCQPLESDIWYGLLVVIDQPLVIDVNP
jgi:hypothetical protein